MSNSKAVSKITYICTHLDQDIRFNLKQNVFWEEESLMSVPPKPELHLGVQVLVIKGLKPNENKQT